jgi:hypothetical protein
MGSLEKRRGEAVEGAAVQLGDVSDPLAGAPRQEDLLKRVPVSVQRFWSQPASLPVHEVVVHKVAQRRSRRRVQDRNGHDSDPLIEGIDALVSQQMSQNLLLISN